MAPHDELAHGATEHVLAKPGEAYIAYTTIGSTVGIKGLPQGDYDLRWFDPVTGTEIKETKTLPAGDQALSKPGSIGAEAALYLEKK
jgi:hypothetical protein